MKPGSPEMGVSIEEEASEKELVACMLASRGPRVAELSTAMIQSNRSSLVVNACMACANRCDPEHAKVIIDVFALKASVMRTQGGLAAAIATIMHGVQTGFLHPVSDQPARRIVDSIIETGRLLVLDNLDKLPAWMGRKWSGVVALAAAATRAKTPQEPLVRNDQLEHLHATKAREEPAVERGATNSTKMALLWTFSQSKAADPPPASSFVGEGWRHVVVDDVPSDNRGANICITRDGT
jgi:hypothetical protein